MKGPDYSGGSLLNLVAELEHRLTGASEAPRLHDHLKATIPDATSYVLVLFDGLGDLQLGHPAATALVRSRREALDAPFPTTTTVSLATVATGLSPAAHGLLGYQLWLPEHDRVVGTIKWKTLWGDPIDEDFDSFLPGPNLWERLRAHGIEPITVQPWNFAGTPLSRVLYRGCGWEPWRSESEAAETAAALAAVPGRLVFLYLPHVDFAAHVTGQDSDAYRDALTIVGDAWTRLVEHLPEGTVAVGTADHGHIDVPEQRRARIDKADHAGREFGGDARALFVYGEGATLAERLPARWVERSDMEHWWGPGPRHAAFDERTPRGVLVADPGHGLLHRFSNDRLIGQHGALTPEELRIPLLVEAK